MGEWCHGLDEEQEVDIFKALGHPLRRKILRMIAERGSVSYKELSRIEPKSGVLYHHLRLLGDLIYQDDNRRYRLTEKGARAYELLMSVFLEPQDKSIHRFLAPRWMFELIEGKISLLVVGVFLASTLLWWGSRDIPVLLTIIPNYGSTILPKVFIPIINWVSSSVVTTWIIRFVLGRRVSVVDVMVKSTPSFIIINLYPVVIWMFPHTVLDIVFLCIIQFFALMFLVSAVSVVGRVSLRKAGIIVIVLHYISLLVAVALVSI